MKRLKLLILLAVMTSAKALALPATETAADTIIVSSEKPKAVSNHSFSVQIVGIEYGYEQKLGGSFSMVFRAGMVPSGLYYLGNYHKTEFTFTSSLGINIEPRFYTNFGRRARLGKSTFYELPVSRSLSAIPLRIRILTPLQQLKLFCMKTIKVNLLIAVLTVVSVFAASAQYA